MSAELSFKEIAERSIKRGEFRILPIVVGAKKPAISWKDTDFDLMSEMDWSFEVENWIEQLSKQFPNLNACVVAKPNEMLFIDEDKMREFRAAYEEFSGVKFPSTFTTSARDNHAQSHWLQTDETRKLGNVAQTDFISVRQRNLYVLAEGSRHPSGSTYQAIDDSPIVPMPDKLVEFIGIITKRAETAFENALNVSLSGTEEEKLAQFLASIGDNSIPYGSHDTRLTKIAGKLRQTFKMDAEQMIPYLEDICERACVDKGDDWRDMCANKAKSVGKYAIKDDRILFSPPKTAPSKPAAGLSIVRADSVEMKLVRWLWQDRVPFGKLTIFAGDPDRGKSLVSLDMVARATTGRGMYGDDKTHEPVDALILAAEDDLTDTLVPRLKAAGADTSRVFVVESVMLQGGGKREVQLDQDLQAIEAHIAANPNIKVIIIDPMSSYLGAARMHVEQDVRKVLGPVKSLAERTGIAVIALMHLNKSNDSQAMQRVGGAMAFVGLSRAAWFFGPDNDVDGQNQMLRIKGNLARKQGGFTYKIDVRNVEIEGISRFQPFIQWTGHTEKNADDALFKAPSTKTESTEDWLKGFLKSGPELFTDIKKNAPKGTSLRTLQRAREDAGIKSRKTADGQEWYLAEHEDMLGDGNNNVSFDAPKAA